jgi:hypothetical protein
MFVVSDGIEYPLTAMCQQEKFIIRSLRLNLEKNNGKLREFFFRMPFVGQCFLP